jgi:CHAT domain-containing protein/tetratricopeptide (TPR) repeat protein
MLLTGLLCCRSNDETSAPAPASPLTKLLAAGPAAAACDTAAQTTLDALLSTIKDDPDQAERQLDALYRQTRACANPALDSALAEAWHRLGPVFSARQEHTRALFQFAKSLELRRQIFAASHLDVLRSYHMLGLTYAAMNDPQTALEYYRKADATAYGVAPTARLHAPTLVRTGIEYWKLYDLPAALLYFEQACAYIDSNQAWYYKPEALKYYASCYRKQGRLAEAIAKGEACVAAIREHRDAFPDESTVQAKVADAYMVLGNIWQDSLLAATTVSAKEQAQREAIRFTESALAIQRTLGQVENLILGAGNLGELYRRSGEPARAEQLITETLGEYGPAVAGKTALAPLYINRGESRLDQGRLTEALADCDTVLWYLTNTRPSDGLPAVTAPAADRTDLMVVYSNMARAYLAQYQRSPAPASLDRAVAVYDTLIALINRMRGDFLDDETKIDLAGRSQQVLRQAFGVCVQLAAITGDRRYLERAFAISEQSKSFALLERARDNNIRHTLPRDVQQEERRLTRDEAALELALVAAAADKATTDSLQRAKIALVEARRAFQQRLKNEHGDYYRLKYQGAAASVETLQRELLDRDQALVEYFFVDSVLYTFLLTRDTFALRQTVVPREFFASVPAFTALVQRSDSAGFISRSREQRLCELGKGLYDQVLAPFAAYLPERLIVVPAAPLQAVPFEALLPRFEPGGLPVNARHFLVNDYAISYCYSANLLLEMKKRPLPAGQKRRLAAFAPVFHPALAATSPSPGEQFGTVAHYLREIANGREVRAIARTTATDTFLDRSATKEQFFDACQRYSMVHVATHGLLDDRDPGLNLIAFEQHAPELNPAQLLLLKELYGQRWNLDLIVFSACQTAAGKYRAGEGNMSMGRGLAYAGVRSFITTLWDTPSEGLLHVMPAFYEQFCTQREPKDVALARAKRTLLLDRNRQAPRNWAGIVLIGASDAPAGAPGIWRWIAMIAAGIVAGGAWFAWKMRGKIKFKAWRPRFWR